MKLERIFDADQHIVEPADFWTGRLSKKYEAVAPQVITSPDGKQAWSFDSGAIVIPMGLVAAAGRAAKDLSSYVRYEQMNAGCYDSSARIKDMDIDGIDAALVFSSVAMSAASVQDDGLHLEIFRAYNDALWDWAQAGDASRILPVALMPSLGVEIALEELTRIAKKGYRTYQFNSWPSGGRYPTSADDPFWAACEDAGIVISLHGPGVGRRRTASGEVAKPAHRPQEVVSDNRASGFGVQAPTAMFILSGILERFPKLKIGLIETGVGWWPYFQEQLDDTYAYQRATWNGNLRAAPSSYLQRQVKATIQLDGAGIRYRDIVGADNIMFSTDYPHSACDWPNSRQWAHFLLHGVPEKEAAQILRENAGRFYGVIS